MSAVEGPTTYKVLRAATSCPSARSTTSAEPVDCTDGIEDALVRLYYSACIQIVNYEGFWQHECEVQQ